MKCQSPKCNDDIIEYKELNKLKKHVLNLIERNYSEMTVKYGDGEPRHLFIVDRSGRSGLQEFLRVILEEAGFKDYHVIVGSRSEYDIPLPSEHTKGNVYMLTYEKEVQFESDFMQNKAG